jgi:hypothetical protein
MSLACSLLVFKEKNSPLETRKKLAIRNKKKLANVISLEGWKLNWQNYQLTRLQKPTLASQVT